MQGLLIKDELRWHGKWSSEIGKQLAVKDSTKDLYIFDPKHSRKDILKLLNQVPADMYQLLDLEEAAEEDCDYMADSGLCYRKIH